MSRIDGMNTAAVGAANPSLLSATMTAYPPPYRRPSGRWSAVTPLDLAFAMGTLLFCMAVSLGQPVNPHPEDGWFDSRLRIFVSQMGGDNFTPVAAPAYLYAAVDGLARLAGGSLRDVFYLGAVVHGLMLWATGMLLYRCNRLHDTGTPGIAVTAATVVALAATLITQSFWSENTTILLMAACLCTLSYLYCRPGSTTGRFLFECVLFGLLLGIFTVTRVLPIILLPAACLTLWPRIGIRRVTGFAVISTSVVLLVLVAAMGANALRFGRFELSNSTGRHLWNAVSPVADVMLADSADYGELRRHIPDIQGRMAWQFDYAALPDSVSKGRDREAFLKSLSREAITSHPALFLATGLNKGREYLLKSPERWEVAVWAPAHSDPLGVVGVLPPLVPSLAGLRGVLDRVDGLAKRFYGRVVFLVAYVISIASIVTLVARPWRELSGTDPHESRQLAAGAFPVALCFAATQVVLVACAAFFRRPLGQVAPYACLMLGYFLGWRGEQTRSIGLQQALAGVRRFSEHVPYAVFLLYTFLVSCCLCWMIETAVTRYSLPYLPALSLGTALAISMIATFLRPGGRSA